MDVYDERFTPLRMVRQASERDSRVRIELSMRQGLSVALPALRRLELDAAFGRVHDTPAPWPAELAYRLVRLEPLHAFVPEDHRLAARDVLRPADLREAGIAMPDPAGAAEWRGGAGRDEHRPGRERPAPHPDRRADAADALVGRLAPA
ncbi:LysR substrate-binding domain-containing protein [Nonomuraea sp. NPDC051941]|uniref:LysR substrate-binding domain-containing protein n=1 Tax=Nonomuraea sp. NPDC051941 TaxID=3364373 RepID=UPI0037C73E6D